MLFSDWTVVTATAPVLEVVLGFVEAVTAKDIVAVVHSSCSAIRVGGVVVVVVVVVAAAAAAAVGDRPGLISAVKFQIQKS